MRSTYRFKTKNPIFEKEKKGIKPYTVREIDLEDSRFLELIAHNEVGYHQGELKIEIEATTTEELFCRDISDITIWKKLMMIAWIHEEHSQKNKSEEQ